MAIPKAASVLVGLAMVGFGVYQFSQGMKGCNGTHDLDWGPTRATSFDVGDFTIKIPDGWRDGAEARDDKMKELLAQQPGARVLVREKFDGQIVLVKSAPGETPAGAPPCNDLATGLAAAEGSKASDISAQTYQSDPGCRWIAKKGELSMQYNVRFHGASVFLVACSGDGALCTPVLANVTAKK